MSPSNFHSRDANMTNHLGHAFVGCMITLAASAVACPSHAGEAAFAGALSALLVNLDRYELPTGRRTPFGHSLAAWALWSSISTTALAALCEAGVLGTSSLVPISYGASIGYGSHLLIDAFSAEGVYLMPNHEFPAMDSLPEGCTRQWAGWSQISVRRAQKSYIRETTNQYARSSSSSAPRSGNLRATTRQKALP